MNKAMVSGWIGSKGVRVREADPGQGLPNSIWFDMGLVKENFPRHPVDVWVDVVASNKTAEVIAGMGLEAGSMVWVEGVLKNLWTEATHKGKKVKNRRLVIRAERVYKGPKNKFSEDDPEEFKDLGRKPKPF